MSYYLGIDFGTSTCRVAVYQENKPLVVPTRFIEQRLNSLKKTFHGIDQDFLSSLKFSSIKQKIGFEETIHLKNKEVRLFDLASDIFRWLKADAENYLKREFDGAVISVPSCFADKQRAALNIAAEKSGFGTVKLLDDSIATVLGCQLKENYGNILVYSMGTGIFNISIIQNNVNTARALWHEGDKNIGGQDFDTVIIRYIIENLGIDYSIYSLRSIYALKKIAENLKIKLSNVDEVKVEIDIINDLKLEAATIRKNKHLISLVRKEFETRIYDLIEYTIEKTKKAFQGAKLSYNDIDAILLIGGSTQIPIIRKWLHEEFGREVIQTSMDSIAMGAAIYSTQLPKPEKKQSEKIQEIQKPLKSRSSPETIKKEEKQSKSEYSWIKMFDQYFIDAESLWKEGEKDGAISKLEALHQTLMEYIAHLYWDRGNDLLHTEKIDEAIEYFKKGYSINKEDNSIRSSLHQTFRKKAYLLATQKRYVEAKKYIKTGLKLNPDCNACRELYNQIEAAIKGQRYSGSHRSGKHRRRK